MTRTILFMIFAMTMLSVSAVSTPLMAQQMRLCAPRDTIVEKLESRFKETRRSYGLQQAAGIFEVYASESGTWTMILTSPQGMTCILAAGEAWSDDKASIMAMGDPA